MHVYAHVMFMYACTYVMCGARARGASQVLCLRGCAHSFAERHAAAARDLRAELARVEREQRLAPAARAALLLHPEAAQAGRPLCVDNLDFARRDVRLRLGRNALQRGQLAEARALLEEGLRDVPISSRDGYWDANACNAEYALAYVCLRIMDEVRWGRGGCGRCGVVGRTHASCFDTWKAGKERQMRGPTRRERREPQRARQTVHLRAERAFGQTCALARRRTCAWGASTTAKPPCASERSLRRSGRR